MAGLWTKMDAALDDDPKFLQYLALSGTSANARLANEARYLRLVRAWTLTDDGIIHLDRPGDVALLERKVGLSGKRLRDWLALLSECGLIRDTGFEMFGTVSCERSEADARLRLKRSDAGKAAAAAKAKGASNRATNR